MISKNTYRTASLALFSAIAIFISTSAAAAATRTVINNHDGGAGSLRQAISNSSSGDTINFNSSLNGQTITLTSGELLINKNLRIKGPGAKKLTISGNNAVRVFNVTATGTVTVSFSGLTIANGVADNGGGIYNGGGTLTITNSTVSGNSAVGYNNQTGVGGGIVNGGTLTIINSTVSGNSATFSDSELPSEVSGGGIYNGGGTLTIINTTVSSNSADGAFNDTGSGGGIYNYGTGDTVNITNSTVTGNVAESGGGISNNGTVNIINSTFSGNGANGTNNAAGGGILNYSGIVTITNSTVSGNGAVFPGGGIYSYTGKVTITNSEISGNSAENGGGIGNGGTLTVTNSTLSGNVATTFGGGGIDNGGRLTVTNSTLSGNSATGGSSGFNFGGGIFNSGTVNITNSTVSSNSTDNGGGGIYNYGTAPANIKSSIIALNTTTSSGPDVTGSFTSSGFNLIGKTDGSMGFTAPTDLTGTVASPLDPKLDPSGLQNNGGPTQTIALLSGSPAIDKATSNGLTGPLTTDQRGTGFPRTFDYPGIKNAKGGDGTDIGAFEFRAPLTPISISRKMHGSAGSFDIDLPFSGHDGIECRTGGTSGDHEVIMTFATPVTVNGNPQAQITLGSGQIGAGGLSNGGVVSVNGAVVTVPLTNVVNAQTIRIRLNNVSDGTNRNNVSIPMGVLLGDVNATRLVDSNDVSLVQGHTGKTANSTNFRFDVDASGLIDGNDVSLVKSKLGTRLP